MPQLRIEICEAHLHYAPEVIVSGTIEVGHLTTPAGSQVRAPEGGYAPAYFARVEALSAPAYVAVGCTPDPTREPRTLVLPRRSPDLTATLRVRPGEGVAAILADDVEWSR